MKLWLVDRLTGSGVVLLDPGARVVWHRVNADEPIDELGRATKIDHHVFVPHRQ